MTGVAMTVLGPVDPAELGVSLMHEHLFLDARAAYFDAARARDPEASHRRLEMSLLGELRWDPAAYADNLLIEDGAVVAEEVAAFCRFGGGTIVDMTTVGLAPRPADAAEISRLTGAHVVYGCGYYLHRTHPDWLAAASVEAITESIRSDLAEGIGTSTIRAGIVGEIGTSNPPTDRELRVVRAAATAASEAGASLNIHVDPRGENAFAALAAIERVGHDPARTIISHLDLRLDVDYHIRILERGVIGSYDCFGAEGYNGGQVDARDPSDQDRLAALARLVEAGYAAQLVISHDVYTKQQMAAYGGMGFAHIPSRILPLIEERLGGDVAGMIAVETPRRLLTLGGS